MYQSAARRSLLAALPRKSLTSPGTAQGSGKQWVRHIGSNHRPHEFQQPAKPRRGRGLAYLSVLAACAGATWYFYPELVGGGAAEQGGKKGPGIEFEAERKTPTSIEENRDLISPQHTQIKKSWENPGVYAWGSNAGKVVAPESNESVVKTPRRIAWFDGKVLRDLKLDRNFGVAVTEEGDIVQWGAQFSPETTAAGPVPTLTGKDIAKVAISSDRIIALSKRGDVVYSLPVSRADQQAGDNKAHESSSSSSWFSFWSAGPSSPAVGFRTLKPELGWGEKIVDVKSGLDHCLLLTSNGRVFSAASSSESFPARGQLGVPGLTWLTRPKGRYDQPYEVKGLPKVGIAQIATGNYHSLALDKSARVYAWGDNSSGQLGFELDPEHPSVDKPTPVPLASLYNRGVDGVSSSPSATSIAAGGSNSYFTVETGNHSLGSSGSRIVADTWACGAGIYGGLGTGKWTHISSAPTQIKALSGLFEYDDATQRTVPIRLASLSVGSTHAAATMSNITSVAASAAGASSSSQTQNATNWGSDVVWWGGNEFYQLGTGKRSNLAEPAYIAPLDGSGGKSGSESNRFQVAPRNTIRLGGEGGKGRKVLVEQRVECGRYVSAVYSATTQ